MPIQHPPPPQIGDVVLFHFWAHGRPDSARIRPAIVTSVEGETVNLYVFYEAHEDWAPQRRNIPLLDTVGGGPLGQWSRRRPFTHG